MALRRPPNCQPRHSSPAPARAGRAPIGAAVRGTRETWQRHAQGARSPPSSEQGARNPAPSEQDTRSPAPSALTRTGRGLIGASRGGATWGGRGRRRTLASALGALRSLALTGLTLRDLGGGVCGRSGGGGTSFGFLSRNPDRQPVDHLPGHRLQP